MKTIKFLVITLLMTLGATTMFAQIETAPMAEYIYFRVDVSEDPYLSSQSAVVYGEFINPNPELSYDFDPRYFSDAQEEFGGSFFGAVLGPNDAPSLKKVRVHIGQYFAQYIGYEDHVYFDPDDFVHSSRYPHEVPVPTGPAIDTP
ncbi:MAG: hypothetical protein LBM67_04070 [Lentimicrobiaceae bacterium]|jgi:hypothetical protein|nr:hypothetical protein [Lentimicrobiaceae bacterium]